MWVLVTSRPFFFLTLQGAWEVYRNGRVPGSPLPWVAVILLFAGSFSLVLLDVAGGLPFMMAVKPSERTEMAAVYSSFRDVSGILTPGAAWLVLAQDRAALQRLYAELKAADSGASPRRDSAASKAAISACAMASYG